MKLLEERAKVCILGAGRSGLAAAKLAEAHGLDVFVSEKNLAARNTLRESEFRHECGGHSNRVLESDFIVLSPGIPVDVPILQKAATANIPVISEVEFAFQHCEGDVLALTGSNGKTTTVHLLHAALNRKNCYLCGNMGVAFSKAVLQAEGKENPLFVLELSSFQLERIDRFRPKVAGILNISPDHMDRYENMDAYAKAKLRIAKNLEQANSLYYNADSAWLSEAFCNLAQARAFNGADAFFRWQGDVLMADEKTVLTLQDTKLLGAHNKENMLMAAHMAQAYGAKIDAIKNAFLHFEPVPHRLQFIAECSGRKFYNDSKATNPASALAAVQSFDGNLTIILGGSMKGKDDLRELKKAMLGKVNRVIAYGDAGIYFQSQLSDFFQFEYAPLFHDACRKAAESEGIILLSPAAASFDQFDNFEERGTAFAKFAKEFCG